MTDLIFGTILSWVVIIGAASYLLYHWFQVARSRKLTPTNGAAIMFSTGMLVLYAPELGYQLDPSELNTLSWIGIAMVVASFILAVPEIRRKWDSRTPGTPST